MQVYKGVSGDVTIVDAGAGRKLTISSTAGWSDTVVWSPYGDEGMGYRAFVCVEAVSTPDSCLLCRFGLAGRFGLPACKQRLLLR